MDAYLRATYARNFAVAYDYLSSADRQVRTRQNYVDSQGGYSGFTLEVAQQLAGFMKVWLIDQKESGGRLVIKVGYRVPAPAELNDLLLHWDQDRLNAFPRRSKKNFWPNSTPAIKPASYSTSRAKKPSISSQGPKVGRSSSTGRAGTRVLLQANYPTAINWKCASPRLK